MPGVLVVTLIVEIDRAVIEVEAAVSVRCEEEGLLFIDVLSGTFYQDISIARSDIY